MRLRRTAMVVSKIFWSLRHDRRSLALIIVAPIMAMFIFGIAFSGEVEDVEVIVINNDKGFTDPLSGISFSLSSEVLDNLDDSKVIVTYMDDMEKAVRKVESGDQWSLIVFPENFTSDMVAVSQGQTDIAPLGIIIRSDQSNINVAQEVNMAFMSAMADTMEDRGFVNPVSIDADDPIYGENAEFIDMFVPGIMGFVVFMLTTMLTLVTFVGERTRGTLDRLLASSVTEGEIVFGYALAFSVIGMVQVGILLSLAVMVFDIIVVGNPLIAFLIASILAVVSVSLGIMLSSFAQRESQAIQFFPLIVLPSFLLSGVFWPLEAIPSWLRPVSYMIPVTYAVEGLRSVLLRGWGIADIWLDVLVLLSFALVFLFGAVMSLKFKRMRA